MSPGVMNLCPACAPAYSEVRERFVFPASRLASRAWRREQCALQHAAWHRHIASVVDSGWTVLRDGGEPVGMVWREPLPRVVGKTQWVSGLPIGGGA